MQLPLRRRPTLLVESLAGWRDRLPAGYPPRPVSVASDFCAQAAATLRRHLRYPSVAVRPIFASAVSAWPELAAEIGPDLFRLGAVADTLRSDLEAFAHLALAHYATLPLDLESELLAYAPYAGDVLMAARQGTLLLRRDPAAYAATLLTQPVWGWEYVTRSGDQDLADRLCEACAPAAERSPQAALALLLSEGRTPTPAESALLHQDPLAAYLASGSLALHGFELKVANIQGLTPQWAAHIALAGIHDGDLATLHAAMAAHAGWLGEYAAERLATAAGCRIVGALLPAVEAQEQLPTAVWTDLYFGWALQLLASVSPAPAK